MKKISSQGVIGQQGVNLVERIVLGMKYIWRPTPWFDVGIDGEIEVCDPITGAATNSYIKVQVKSTEQSFIAETPESFEFLCEERDIDYWLNGNAPVILVVARPKNNEAYWISIKKYFSDPALQKTRKLIFNKRLNRFDENVALTLKSLALPVDAGVYFSPLDTTETLYTNLLAVKSFAKSIYVAETNFHEVSKIWDKLNRAKGKIGPEWILRNKMIVSFRPLDEFPFDSVCDSGSCEQFDVDEWSNTDDEEKKRDFVQLLNMSLRQRTKLLGLQYHKNLEFYYFPAPQNLNIVRIEYQSIKQRSGREVFKQYSGKSEPTRKTYCRHSAFKGFFVRLGNEWYLEITPTYHFTKFGWKDHPYREELLKGIKRLERNPAVVGQLLMWVDFLKRPLQDLFSEEYTFLSFGDLKTVTLNAGIPDNTWYEAEEDIEKETLTEQDNQPELFGL